MAKSKKDILERKNYKNDSDPKTLCEEFKKAYDYYSDIRDDFDAKEAILMGKSKDRISSEVAKSQVFDPRLSTMVFERMSRVMSGLSTGKVRAIGKKNKGKGMMGDLILHKYIEPNANQQYNILTKFRMENLYSHVYGSFAHFVDYFITEDYIGPDFRLIPIRHLVPQPGKYNIKDCQYIFVGSWVPKEALEKLRNKDKWQNIDKLIEKSKGDKTNSRIDTDQSYNQLQWGQTGHSEGTKKYQQVYLVTKYEKDRWVTFAPDYNLIVRDIENPHMNGKIPVVVKHSIPLIDRFIGLGDVERGQTLQYAINSLWNLYLDGIKFSIFPPKLINLVNVVPSTIKNQPAANWVVKDINNSIKEFPISPQGINSFQATYPTLIASLMNLAGTTDTTVSATADPALGKTPQAIAFLNARQNARDAFDRDMQEEVIQDTYDLFLDLITKKQELPIKITDFSDEIQQIAEINPDIVDMFEEDGGEITIKPDDVKGTNFKFYIDKGSTYRKDEVLEKQEITDHLALALKLADPQELRQTGKARLGEKVIDVAELFKKSVISGGIQDWDKIVYDEPMPQQPQGQPEIDPMTGQPLTQGMPQGQPTQPGMQPAPMQGNMQPQRVNFEDPQIQSIADELYGSMGIK